MRLSIAIVLASSSLLALPSLAHAGSDLVFDHLAAGAIKLDGKIKEWPGTTAGDVTVKSGSATATFSIGYDDTGVWVGAEVVKDGSVARTSAFGPNEDCVSLVLAFPKAGVAAPTADYVAYDVGLYAGVPGSSAGDVRMRASGKSIAGAKIIEASRKGGGYTLEAFIPWSAFAEAKKTRAGLRAALRSYDCDGSAIRSIKATGAGTADSPTTLDFLLNEPEQSLPTALSTKKLAWKDVTYDVTADLAGDGTYERALFAGRSLFVLGPTYKEGKQWLNVELGVDVVAVEAKDVTGDGHADLVLTTRAKGAGSTRDALVVYALMGEKGAEKPSRVFAHEVAIDGGSGKVLRDVVTFSGKKASVVYSAAKGWDGSSYKEPFSTDVDPILLPWGAVKERDFTFDGASFVKDKEVAQKATVVVTEAPPATKTTTTTTTTSTATSTASTADPAVAALAAYRKEKGLASSASSRFEQVVATGTGKKGRVALFGRDLVITSGGPEVSYAYVNMARFASDADVMEVSAKDLTGDGRDDVLVRGIVRAKLSVPGKADQEVLREILTIYAPKVSGSAVTLTPVLSVEVARASGSNRVEATLRIVTASAGKAGHIEVGKGTAKGWTQSTWPFESESATPGLEPLILPWGKETTVTYAWSGEKFAKS